MTAGWARRKRADQGGHRVCRQRRERGEVEASGHQPRDGRHCLRGVVEVAERLPGRRHEGLACRREGRAAAGADRAAAVAELGLQLADRQRHGRLSDVLGDGSRREASLVDDREEQAQAAKIHRKIIW